jgi:hypothetical protein
MLGKILTAPLAILHFGVGLWGFFLTLKYMSEKIGLFFTLISLFLAPIVYGLAPLYAGFVDGYWTPALVSYAPVALYMLVAAIGGMASRGR